MKNHEIRFSCGKELKELVENLKNKIASGMKLSDFERALFKHALNDLKQKIYNKKTIQFSQGKDGLEIK